MTPANWGSGPVDGIASDSHGNLWCAMIFADRLVAIDPNGDLLTLLDNGDSNATAQFEAAFATGKPVPIEIMTACGGNIAPCLSSIAFGGPNLDTVYLGSLKGTTIP